MSGSDYDPSPVDLATAADQLRASGFPVGARNLQEACRNQVLRCCRRGPRGKWQISAEEAARYSKETTYFNSARPGPPAIASRTVLSAITEYEALLSASRAERDCKEPRKPRGKRDLRVDWRKSGGKFS